MIESWLSINNFWSKSGVELFENVKSSLSSVIGFLFKVVLAWFNTFIVIAACQRHLILTNLFFMYSFYYLFRFILSNWKANHAKGLLLDTSCMKGITLVMERITINGIWTFLFEFSMHSFVVWFVLIININRWSSHLSSSFLNFIYFSFVCILVYACLWLHIRILLREKQRWWSRCIILRLAM